MTFCVTNCLKCCFAQYEENVQVGCALKRTGLVPTVQKHDEESGRSYLELQGACNAYRPLGSLFTLRYPPEERVARVLEETRVTIDGIVLVQKETLYSDILDILEYARNQNHPLSSLHFVRYSDAVVESSTLRRLMDENAWANITLTILSPKLSTHDDGILEILPRLHAKYLMVFGNGAPLRCKQPVEAMNTLTNTHMEKVAILWDDFVIAHRGIYMNYDAAVYRMSDDDRYRDSTNVLEGLIWMGGYGEDDDAHTVVFYEDVMQCV